MSYRQQRNWQLSVRQRREQPQSVRNAGQLRSGPQRKRQRSEKPTGEENKNA